MHILQQQKRAFLNTKYVARKTTKFISFSHHLCAHGRPPERHQCCKTAEKFDLASLEVADETSPAPPGAPSPPQEPQVPPRSPQGHPRSSQCLPKSPQELSETSSRDKHYINKNSRSTAGRPVCYIILYYISLIAGVG